MAADHLNERDPESFLPLLARDFYILFFLAQGQRHGYGLVKEIEAHSRGTVRLDPANLYRAIQKLTLAGLVVDGPRSTEGATGRERRYHVISELGRRVMNAEATRMRELAAAAADCELLRDTER